MQFLENYGKYIKKKGIKLVKTERRRNYLALELNLWFQPSILIKFNHSMNLS